MLGGMDRKTDVNSRTGARTPVLAGPVMNLLHPMEPCQDFSHFFFLILIYIIDKTISIIF